MNPEQITTRPPAALVASLRAKHNLTQTQCAAMLAITERSYQGHEEKDGSMRLATWWLFLLRLGEIHLADLPPIPPRERFFAT